MQTLQPVRNGQTSNIFRVKLYNSTVTTQAGLTGLTSASAGLIIGTICDSEASTTTYTVTASHIQTITTLGTFAAPSASNIRFKEVDSTNHPGVYEIQIADARMSVAGAKSIIISFSGATNLAQTDVLIPLTAFDPYDAVRGALTALPNANAAASGGLVINGSNAGAMTIAGLTLVGANAVTSTPASPGLTITGGAASTTGGGTAAAGVSIIGGPGAASTNGAASGATVAAGGTTTVSGNDAITFTGTGNGNGVTMTHAGTGLDLNATTTALSAILTNAGIDAILDRANGVETSFTLRQAMRLMLSTLAGKISGASTTTITIRDVNDTTNRIVATVDSSGDRSALTYIVT